MVPFTLALGLALLAGLFAALIAAMEIGRRRGQIAFAKTDAGERPAGLSTVEAVAFGLLGLLMAFTFSGAAARLDARRAQIVDEANAIGTAWLRLDVLPPAAQPPLRDLFRRYTDSRIALYHIFSHEGVDAARAEFARSAALQSEIWAAAVAASRDAGSSTAVIVLPALNSMFDLASARIAATQMHPPVIVYLVLAAISLMCGFLVGFEMGATPSPSRAHMVMLAAVLSFTFCVILDFEYPRLGMIRIDDFDQLIAGVRAAMQP
jgi:hypothetical protein